MNKIKRKVDIVNIEDTKKDINIIHLADIHFSINTKTSQLDEIKKMIYVNNPDYIMITGDLVDDSSIIKNKYKIVELVSFLSDISEIAPVIISLGNHDILVNSDKLFFKKLNELNNIYVLDNDVYVDEYVYVAGFTLPNNYYYNIEHDESVRVLLEYLTEQKKILKRKSRGLVGIALIHSPICLTEKEVLDKLSGFDLILSGHTHGGMIPEFMDRFFPKNIGLIAPNKKLIPDVARGRIDKYVKNRRITIIINSGITKLSRKSGKIFSLFNFIYNMSVNKIIITKKRGIRYE